jgi:Heterokaryon incompatibility protein (HET)
MDLRGSNQRYIYEFLSYGENRHPIRLLKILPGEPGSCICCQLFHFHLFDIEEDYNSESDSDWETMEDSDIEENPKYTALSYVWGDHTDTVAIKIDGKELSVTRNLFKFLECHRDNFPLHESTEDLFWIDAICIDQSNIEERSRQVGAMAKVYKQAQNVLIWLGEEKEYTSIAFETAKKWTEDYQLTEQECQACSETFEGGWWDRLWVVQEAVHARGLLMRCGTFELSWESFGGGVPWSGAPFRAAGVVSGCRKEFQKHDSEAILVLSMFGRRKCYDPRDVIFGTKSIIPALKSVVPDYSLCTADVFISATRAIISFRKDLKVLALTRRNGPSQCKS